MVMNPERPEFMTFFLAFYLSIPLFFRMRNIRFSFAHGIGLLGDLFIAYELIFLIYFLPFLGKPTGLFFHLYSIFDGMLWQTMRMRMRLSFLLNLKGASCLYFSAKELGIHRFFMLAPCITAFHLLFHSYFVVHITWTDLIFMLFIGAGSFWGTLHLKKKSHEVCNSLLLEQIGGLNRLKKQSVSKPLTFRPFAFSGHKLFDVSGQPHVVFLFLESFGQKVISPKATPHFCRLQKDGLYFSNFYSNGTLTYRAMLSSLFGVPASSKAIGLSPYVKAPLLGLPGLLKWQGYQTAFHHSGSLGFDWQKEFLERHFEEVRDRMDINGTSSFTWGIEDEWLIRYSADWLEKQSQPSFLTLFTITNHHPWVLPKCYNAPSFGFPAKAPQERFLKTVHYTDYCLGLFLELLRAKNISQNTILFILGDHGQPMGEHQDNYYNSRFLYEENIRIPLLILGDGKISKPMQLDQLGSQLDLLPTIVDLLNFKGQAPYLGESLLRPQQRAVYFQNPYSEGWIGCRKEAWKWISGELYNLDQDPEEKTNLASQFPEISNELCQKTEQFFAQVDAFHQDNDSVEKSKSLFELDLSQKVILDEELIEQIQPSLRRVRLENCLMLSDLSIIHILQKCPQLESLQLKGVTDLTDQLFDQGLFPHLVQLDLSDARNISDQGWIKLTQSCPGISELSLNGAQLTDEGLSKIGSRIGSRMLHFRLYDAKQITEKGLIQFLQQSPHLTRLVLDGCPNLTDDVLLALEHHPLEQLWILGSTRHTQTGEAFLKKLPIRSLVLN